jgi:hypothetical protein
MVPMTRWLRCEWDEDECEIHALWEVDDDGWMTRSVELRGREERPEVAASLDVWMRELDAGRIQAYQARYGVLVEKPITEWDFPHSNVTAEEFETVWQSARRELQSREPS